MTSSERGPEPEPTPVGAALTAQMLQLDPGLEHLAYAHDGDAGADLRARFGLTLAPGHRVLVPTGVALALPRGYAGFVHPRSGLAARHGITVLNAPGVIDAGFRGEICVNLINTDARESFTLSRGDRIAQLVIQRVEPVNFEAVTTLDVTPRGTGGHGSSGGFTDAPSRTQEGK